MIRINLLPFRLARKKENIRRQVSVFFLSIVFIVVLLVWLSITMNNKINLVQGAIASVRSESLKYKKQADRVSQIRKNLKILDAKLKDVERLKSKKKEQLLLLEALSDRVVETRMWLTSVSADPQTVSLKGIAFDNPTIAAFMRKLENTGMFGSVDLILSQTKKFDDTIRLKEFVISCVKKLPAPDADATGNKG